MSIGMEGDLHACSACYGNHLLACFAPFYSVYRDRATLRLVLTVHYLNVYDQHGLDAEDFLVVVPVASIRMASFFDQAAYRAFIVEYLEPQPEPPRIS